MLQTRNLLLRVQQELTAWSHQLVLQGKSQEQQQWFHPSERTSWLHPWQPVRLQRKSLQPWEQQEPVVELQQPEHLHQSLLERKNQQQVVVLLLLSSHLQCHQRIHSCCWMLGQSYW